VSLLPAVFKPSKDQIIPATKTLEAITAGLLKDGGNLYRKFLQLQLPTAADAYRQDDSVLRTHLGASQIGKECSRELWYGFRWAVDPKSRREWHDGPHQVPICFACQKRAADMVRLLNRGHLEEPRVVALLLMIGCTIYQFDEKGKQFKVSIFDGHFGGSCDGVQVGIPDLPVGTPSLVEIKTSNDKNFDKLAKSGVKVVKPEHFYQMQTYMGGLNLTVAIYIAVNKNDDEIWAELVYFDQEVYAAIQAKAKTIVYLNMPPSKISNNPSWHKCAFCEAKHLCHKTLDATGKVPEPVRNCRTCIFSKPVADSLWLCGQTDTTLNKDQQIAGCGKYTRIGGM